MYSEIANKDIIFQKIEMSSQMFLSQASSMCSVVAVWLCLVLPANG